MSNAIPTVRPVGCCWKSLLQVTALKDAVKNVKDTHDTSRAERSAQEWCVYGHVYT